MKSFPTSPSAFKFSLTWSNVLTRFDLLLALMIWLALMLGSIISDKRDQKQKGSPVLIMHVINTPLRYMILDTTKIDPLLCMHYYVAPWPLDYGYLVLKYRAIVKLAIICLQQLDRRLLQPMWPAGLRPKWLGPLKFTGTQLTTPWTAGTTTTSGNLCPRVVGLKALTQGKKGWYSGLRAKIQRSSGDP